MKFINRFFLFFALLSSFLSVGQEDISFIRTYGNTGYDFGRDIKQDNDSGYVVTGSSSSFGADNTEAFLLKLNKYGDFLWSHNYGGSGSDWGQGLVVTNDSTYAVGGYTNSMGAGGFDFYLIRIDAEGTPLWEKTYGGAYWDQAFGLVQLPDSGFVLAGESFSFNDGIRSGYIVRTDKAGDVLWEHVIEAPVESFFTDLAFDGDSLVFCGGIGDGGEETFDAYVYKCGLDGGFGWDRTIGRAYNDYFNAVYAVAGFYSFGGARGYNFPTENMNMWMYRLDDTGVEILDTIYVNESLNFDVIHDIAVRDFDQDYYFIGETQSYGYLLDGKSDIFTGKMNASLEHFATNIYGEAGDDIGRAMDKTRDLGVVFLADTKFFSTGGNNIMVIKLNRFWIYPVMFDEINLNDITNSTPEVTEINFEGIYPNPFTTLIHLPFIPQSSYSIHSIEGKLICSAGLESDILDLSELSNGMYILTLHTPTGNFQQRLIKN